MSQKVSKTDKKITEKKNTGASNSAMIPQKSASVDTTAATKDKKKKKTKDNARENKQKETRVRVAKKTSSKKRKTSSRGKKEELDGEETTKEMMRRQSVEKVFEMLGLSPRRLADPNISWLRPDFSHSPNSDELNKFYDENIGLLKSSSLGFNDNSPFTVNDSDTDENCVDFKRNSLKDSRSSGGNTKKSFQASPIHF